MFGAINTSASGMSATREWMEATTNNISNINTTRTSDGTPYQRQTVNFAAKEMFDDLFSKQVGGGVEVNQVLHDKNVKTVYDPKHPDANEEGYVDYPAIDMAAEISNLIMAQRSYEANVTAFNSTKQVMKKEQEIGRV